MNPPKLLYLGFAFPPGIAGLFPDQQPAGHAMETQMIRALGRHFEIRSAGLHGVDLDRLTRPRDASPGLPHALNLLDKPPELWHWWRSLRRLRGQYQAWLQEGWQPDVVLALNMAPVYSQFVRGLVRSERRPRCVLWLSDSRDLGRPLPALKRLRYRCKPFFVFQNEMAARFDACIGLSRSTEEFFKPRGIPWIWIPGGVDIGRAIDDHDSAANMSLGTSAPTGRRDCEIVRKQTTASDPIQFGYFGALAAHTGIFELIEAFQASPLPNELHVCGYGRQSQEVAALAAKDKRIKFHGLQASPENALRLAQNWDVLVNPRPLGHGNENNFPSKIFEYALCGRAILTTRFSGVDEVLGSGADYFDARSFHASLQEALAALARAPRVELRRRGQALRERVTTQYSWEQQAQKISQFIRSILP